MESSYFGQFQNNQNIRQRNVDLYKNLNSIQFTWHGQIGKIRQSIIVHYTLWPQGTLLLFHIILNHFTKNKSAFMKSTSSIKKLNSFIINKNIGITNCYKYKQIWKIASQNILKDIFTILIFCTLGVCIYYDERLWKRLKL